jgi:alpha-L-rhamnosidase
MHWPCTNAWHPWKVREQVARHLLTDIMETRGGHLHTGFLGTGYLLKALIAMDQPDVAVTVLANQTPPSFASLLRHVDSPEELTFLPEFFGQGMIPHPGWCSVGFWFYQALAGIMPDWEHPGFAGLTVKPQLPARLDWVRAEYDSMVGTVGVSWTRQSPLVELVVRIPANSSAQVHVPALRRASVEVPPGARFAGSTGGSLLFAVDSGTHVFRFEPRAESDWRAARTSNPQP